MGRPPCCDKSNVKRGLWTPEEDAKILAYVSKHGTGNWTLVPKKAGLNRCGKSCRLRWTNYLRPDLNHDDFTPQEEEHIINLHQAVGSRWSLIAKQLPGRTDNDVKNYWNTKLRKKLSKMGIDPLTHKPFSQIFSEFGNISALHALAEPEPSSVITGLLQNNSPALLFHSQFQPMSQDMTMTVQPHFFNDATTSSCSSTSSSLVNDFASTHESYSCQQSSSFNWNEFLLQDPYQVSETTIQEQEDKLQGLNSSTDLNSAGESGVKSTILGGQMSNRLENSSTNSFLDTILDQESELRSAFPEFLDESLEYY